MNCYLLYIHSSFVFLFVDIMELGQQAALDFSSDEGEMEPIVNESLEIPDCEDIP